MQAPGHEEIEKHMAEFLKQLIYVNGNLLGNLSCRAIYSKFYSDPNHDIINRSLYLGNWLTDNSQIFAPDFYFDFQYNLPPVLGSV